MKKTLGLTSVVLIIFIIILTYILFDKHNELNATTTWFIIALIYVITQIICFIFCGWVIFSIRKNIQNKQKNTADALKNLMELREMDMSDSSTNTFDSTNNNVINDTRKNSVDFAS